MQLLTKTIDLAEEAETIAQRIESIEADIDEKTDRALEIDPPSDEDEREEFGQLQADVAELESLLAAAKGYEKALQRAVDEWEGTEVALRELTGSETRHIKDEAAQKAEEMGLGNYSDNVHETLFMEKAIESTPPGAPDNAGDMPNRLFDWLLTRANNLNTVGGFEMGNSSLRERMLEKRDDKQSAPDENDTDIQPTSSK